MYEYYKIPYVSENEHCRMVIAIVKPIETEKDYFDDRRNRCFLYDDIMAFNFSPKIFAELVRIETVPHCRKCGYASDLIKEFMCEYPDIPIFSKVGVLTENEYNELEECGKLQEHIYENIVPFFEKMGFVDVNDTYLSHQSVVVMCYPESLAKKYLEEKSK